MTRKFNKDNLDQSTAYCSFAKEIVEALKKPVKQFNVVLMNFVVVIDDEKKDEALLLVPQNDIHKMRADFQEFLYKHLIETFQTNGLKLRHDITLLRDDYKLGFQPIGFRITCISK